MLSRIDCFNFLSMEDYRVSLSSLPRQHRSPTFIRGRLNMVILVNTGVRLFTEGKTQHSDAAAQWMRYERILKSRFSSLICFLWRPFTVPKEMKLREKYLQGWWLVGRGERSKGSLGPSGDLKTRLAIYPIWEDDTCPVGPSTTAWPDQE